MSISFGQCVVYLDYHIEDPHVVTMGSLWFPDSQVAHEESCVYLYPHAGITGCGRPWMVLSGTRATMSIYPDIMRSVVWYELNVDKPYTILPLDGRVSRLVGCVAMRYDWRAWHYTKFFGSHVTMGQL